MKFCVGRGVLPLSAQRAKTFQPLRIEREIAASQQLIDVAPTLQERERVEMHHDELVILGRALDWQQSQHAFGLPVRIQPTRELQQSSGVSFSKPRNRFVIDSICIAELKLDSKIRREEHIFDDWRSKAFERPEDARLFLCRQFGCACQNLEGKPLVWALFADELPKNSARFRLRSEEHTPELQSPCNL